MSKLLVNGCSYTHCWKNVDELGSRLGYTDITNLGLPGSSNDRIFRTTFEYVSQNPDTKFVILMLTFYDRQEAPWAKYRPYESSWINYSPAGISTFGTSDSFNPGDVVKSYYDNYVAERYKVDINPDYLEKILINLITLLAWLDSQGVDYCVFNACESLINGKAHHLDNKLYYLRKNKKVIDVENFLSNCWMYENGAKIPQDDIDGWNKTNVPLDPRWVHYGLDGYAKLNDFLYNYITNGRNTI